MNSIGVNITKELGKHDFEIFANLLVSALKGDEILYFSDGKDGGIDGNRIAFSNLVDWKENQIIQAKHTNILEKSCSDKDFFGNKTSIIYEEIPKIKKKNDSNKLGSYVLVTNRKLTAGKHGEIRKYISSETGIELNRIELFGLETIIELLKNPPTFKTITTRFPIITIRYEFINVRGLDKQRFLTDINVDEYYQARSIKKETDSRYLFFDEKEPIKLQEILEPKCKIILLGNPGLGKTTELKNIALNLWSVKTETNEIPVFRNLRTFTVSNTIADFIPDECKSINSLCFVFDGVDEIADKQDFLSKLDNYILDNSKKDIKVILSIRTNVYSEYKNSLYDYEVLYLNPLSVKASSSLFESKFGLVNIIEKIPYKHFDIISNPFMLNLYAEYFKSSQTIPYNTGVLWANYIDGRYEKDKEKYAKNNKYDNYTIKSLTKKIAVVNEFVESNEIIHNHLEQICKQQTGDFLKFNPFIDKNLSTNGYYFEHRNIQEYIFAQYLSELPFEKMIQKISFKVDLYNWDEKVLNVLSFQCKKNYMLKFNHTLRNSISYLFLVLSGTKLKQYIEWCKNNEPEILFLSEPNLLEERTKTELFINYFNEVCIKQQLWISNNRAIEELTLADFANNEDGYNFLLNQFNNPKNIQRIRISALSVLGNLDYAKKQKKEALIDSFSISLSKEKDNYLIREIINCCIDLQLFLDEAFLGQTIYKIKDLDNAEINHELLKAINKCNKVDEYFDFFEDEFLKESGEKQRKKTVDFNLSNSYLFKELISKIEKPDNYLKIISHFFENSHGAYHDHFMIDFNVILEKFKFFNKKDNKFIIRFLEKIDVLDRFYLSENQLIQIVTATKTEYLLIEKILYSDHSGYIIYTLSKILNKENINITYAFFKKQCRIHKIHEDMRNNIAENNFDLAVEFENKLKEIDYIFESNLKTKEVKSIEEEDIKKKIIEDVNLLFDKNKLIEKCIKMYNSLEERTNIFIQLNQIDESLCFQGKYYTSVCVGILDSCSRNKENKEITIDLLNKYLNEKRIFNYIKQIFKKDEQIFIKKENIKYIENWCFNKIEEINFDEIIKLVSENSFNLGISYFDWWHVLYFSNKLNIALPKEFCLKSIIFSGEAVMDEDMNKFEYLLSQLNKEEFDKQVIENLNNDAIYTQSLFYHINYALDNNLPNSLPKIKEYILDKELHLNSRDFLEKIYLLDKNDVSFYKKCCEDINSSLCWSAINILKDFDNEEIQKFVLEIACETINSKNDNNYRVGNALDLLFKYNTEDAIKLYYTNLKNSYDDAINFRFKEFKNYNNIKSLDVLPEFYIFCYFECTDRFFDGKSVIDSYISNLSQDKKQYFKLKKVLKSIKKLCINKGLDVFYINKSMNSAEQVYINSFAKKMTFEEALQKVS